MTDQERAEREAEQRPARLLSGEPIEYWEAIEDCNPIEPNTCTLCGHAGTCSICEVDW